MADTGRPVPHKSVKARASGPREIVVDLSSGATSKTIVDAFTDEAWKVCIPVGRRWSWRRIALALATRIRLQQIEHATRTGAPVEQIAGHNGTAVVSLTYYVKVPSHYAEASRQRARIGIEAAASHAGNRNPGLLSDIATGAATGFKMGWRRRGLFPYAVSSWKCFRKLADVEYLFAEGNEEMMSLEIRRVYNMMAGETLNDKIGDALHPTEKATDKQLTSKAVRRARNRERNQADREALRAKARAARQARRDQAGAPEPGEEDPYAKPWP